MWYIFSCGAGGAVVFLALAGCMPCQIWLYFHSRCLSGCSRDVVSRWGYVRGKRSPEGERSGVFRSVCICSLTLSVLYFIFFYDSKQHSTVDMWVNDSADRVPGCMDAHTHTQTGFLLHLVNTYLCKSVLQLNIIWHLSQHLDVWQMTDSKET